MSEARRTAPLSVLAGALGSIQNAVLPVLAIAFSGIGGSDRFALAIGVGLVAAAIGSAISYLSWRRFTYVVGEADIRVESGIISRAARSVPYERIQDVSLAEPLLARLVGLVAVKFETGAGGAEDLSLAYVTAAEAERLRQLVRERREESAAGAVEVSGAPSSDVAAPAAEPEGEVLFAMSPRRLLTFGLFEFSLAVFAVLGGLLQYADNIPGVDVWNVKLWQSWLDEQGSTVAAIGPMAQALAAMAGLVGLVVIGLATGLARTIAREWGFVLTRTARGFRRRRGLFTRTDVVMPVHRVQALEIGTGIVRYRFGWHALRLVSLAQDNKSASHAVAPFAKMSEIAPIAAAAGFALPDERTDWQRASAAYRNDRIAGAALLFLVLAATLAALAPFGWFLIPLGGALVAGVAVVYEWELRRRHAIDEEQVYAMHGLLAPHSQIAKRMKLHSAEIAQNPLARLRGYATLHLGLAGGQLAISGLPLARARELRARVLETMCAADFSRI
ncbi:MAG: PH domain-containing protein [Erythrobacter sp.]